jgi:hypothetical protein
MKPRFAGKQVEFCLLFMRWTVKSLRSDGGAFLGWHRNF